VIKEMTMRNIALRLVLCLQIIFASWGCGEDSSTTVDDSEQERRPSVDDDATPIDDDATPIDDDLTPADDDATPVDDDSTPTDDDVTTVDDDSTPVGDDDATPIDDDLTPADDDSTPVDDDVTPADDDSTPVDDDVTPADDDSTVGDDDATPEIWSPPPRTSWQWQLTGTIDASLDVAMYDIDLFDVEQSKSDELHGEGCVVICYFSAGSYEDWRPDEGEFEPDDLGNKMQGWDELWLDIRSANVRRIMSERLDLAVQKECDGVEPDNVDGYDNSTGFPLSKSDQIEYLLHLSVEAHARGLSIGLKNSLGLIEDVLDHFDWALNEECLFYDECADLRPFIDAGKAVFHVEYVDDPGEGQAKKAEVCGDPSISDYSTLIKTWDLDAWRLTCD
jgi:endo-alpha-1,4-polygalactosaminidase (GH114 family)